MTCRNLVIVAIAKSRGGKSRLESTALAQSMQSGGCEDRFAGYGPKAPMARFFQAPDQYGSPELHTVTSFQTRLRPPLEYINVTVSMALCYWLHSELIFGKIRY